MGEAPPAASAAPVAPAGLAYWRGRVRELGPRAVLNLDHVDPIDGVSARHRATLFPALARLLRGHAATVLDLGCGIGRLTGELAALIGGRAIGADPMPELLALAPPHPSVEYRPMHPPRLPLGDGEADVVFTCLVLGGLVEPGALAAAAAEVHRVLAPGGLVFLAESVSEGPSAAHWSARSVAHYRAAFPWARLEEVARLDDAGDPVSALAGRSAILPGRPSSSPEQA